MNVMQRKIQCQMQIEVMEDRLVPAVVDLGFVAPQVIQGSTPHVWTADSTGKYHTATNLQAEWQGFYQTMLGGGAWSLTPTQRQEGNAEAVFENTGLANVSAADQQAFREDAQREFDAIAGAMRINSQKYHIDGNKPFTEASYINLETTLQNNPTLLELGVQGHGLNNPPASRYNGYTNDFQNNVDNMTLYIGGGLGNNENALTDFFDDNILTHAPFSVIWQDGQLQQLNQNGAAENTLNASVVAMDDTMYGRVYTSADFSQTASDANNGYVSKFQALVDKTAVNVNAPIANGHFQTSNGPVATTLHEAHVWVADANGLFHTATDLNAEWHKIYQTMLNGEAGRLTPVQRLEGNAEAVFENTNINNLDAATQEKYREDAQREFDAIGAAMKINQSQLKINPRAPLTAATYVQLANTLQASPALLELARQGHGLNNPPNPRYNGYTNDFQNNVDNMTTYNGGGLNNGNNALTDFFDDNILSHLPFPVVWQNGQLIQLNQNGAAESTLTQAYKALDQSMYYRVYTSDDFSA